MTIAGGIGALLGGPIGAAVGLGIAGWSSSNSEFEENRLAEVFGTAKQKCAQWEAFDEEQKKAEARQVYEYEKLARDSWHRYHSLRQLGAIDNFNGKEFEVAISIFYEKMGYKVTLTKTTGDFGVDIIAEKGAEKLAIQVKRYKGTVGIQAVQEVASGAFYYKATKAIVTTNSFFTPQAKQLADSVGVDLIDRTQLTEMWGKVHSHKEIPEFNLKKYEAIKNDIILELRKIPNPKRKEKHTPQRKKRS